MELNFLIAGRQKSKYYNLSTNSATSYELFNFHYTLEPTNQLEHSVQILAEVSTQVCQQLLNFSLTYSQEFSLGNFLPSNQLVEKRS